MSYNKTKIPELLSSSYEESYMLTKIPVHKKEGKRVKILKCPDLNSGISFEDIIKEYSSPNELSSLLMTINDGLNKNLSIGHASKMWTNG